MARGTIGGTLVTPLPRSPSAQHEKVRKHRVEKESERRRKELEQRIRLLRHIAETQGLSSTRLREQLGWSSEILGFLRDGLEEDGLIRRVETHTGRGRRADHHYLTGKGETFLRNHPELEINDEDEETDEEPSANALDEEGSDEPTEPTPEELKAIETEVGGNAGNGGRNEHPHQLVVLKPGTDSSCTHYFVLESPTGPTTKGTCRRCGEERTYRSSLPEETYTWR